MTVKLSNLFLFSESVLDDEEAYKETKELLEAVVESFGDWVNNNSVGLYPGTVFNSEEQLQRINSLLEWNKETNENSYSFSTKLGLKQILSDWDGLQLKDPRFVVLVKQEEFFFRIKLQFGHWYKSLGGSLALNQTILLFNITDVNEWYRVYETKFKEFENKVFLDLSEIREEEIRASQPSSS